MIDLSMFTELWIVLLCGGVGFVLKNAFPNFPNNKIPLIVSIIGIIAYAFMEQTVSVQVVTIGLISGLASTGTHQLIKDMQDGIIETKIREGKITKRK